LNPCAWFRGLVADGTDKVADDLVAVGREDGFGVELQAFGWVLYVS
jgi:hypothetical protein